MYIEKRRDGLSPQLHGSRVAPTLILSVFFLNIAFLVALSVAMLTGIDNAFLRAIATFVEVPNP